MLETTGEQQGVPEFAVALRGYDRAQVDDYTRKLIEWAERERAEADAARQRCALALSEATALRERLAALSGQARRPIEPTFAQLGEEAAALFRRAAETAAEIERRAASQAEADAAGIRQAAEGEVAGARAEAERIRSEAAEAGRLAMARLDAQRDEIETEIARLLGKREWFLGEVDRLREALSNLADTVRGDLPEEIDLTIEPTPERIPQTVPASADTRTPIEPFDYDRLNGPLF